MSHGGIIDPNPQESYACKRSGPHQRAKRDSPARSPEFSWVRGQHNQKRCCSNETLRLGTSRKLLKMAQGQVISAMSGPPAEVTRSNHGHRFSMYTVPLEAFLQMTEFQAHEELMEALLQKGHVPLLCFCANGLVHI